MKEPKGFGSRRVKLCMDYLLLDLTSEHIPLFDSEKTQMDINASALLLILESQVTAVMYQQAPVPSSPLELNMLLHLQSVPFLHGCESLPFGCLLQKECELLFMRRLKMQPSQVKLGFKQREITSRVGVFEWNSRSYYFLNRRLPTALRKYKIF